MCVQQSTIQNIFLITEQISKFWESQNIPSDRGGIYNMLIDMTERLLLATRRTAYSDTRKHKPATLAKALGKWPK